MCIPSILWYSTIDCDHDPKKPKVPISEIDYNHLRTLRFAFEELFTDKSDDVDQKIVSWLVEDFKKEQGIDLMQDNMSIQ